MRRAASVLALLLLWTTVAGASDGPTDRQLAPFALQDTRGQRYDASQHIGKDVVVIAFWATWCKPCKIELEALNELYERYREQGMVLLGVSIDGPDSIAEVTNFKRIHGYEFPILLDSETAVLERYNPRGDVPFSMVVDRRGRIVSQHQGYNPGDEIALAEQLDRLLAEEAPVTAGNGEGGSSPMGYWRVAESPHVEGTESLQLRYLFDNANGRSEDDDVLAIVNKLTLGGATGGLSFGIRADSVAYPGYDGEARCEGQADQSKCQWKDDHRIERVWVQLQQQDLDLRVGDLYHSMGRGLVFSVRKIDELGMDTALRGGRARGRVGSLSLQAFGGVTNIQNTDLISAGPLAERQDELVGGEIAWACGPNEPWCALPFNMTIGVRGLYADYNEDENATRDEGDWTVGGSLEMRDLVPDLLSLYFEGAFLRNLNTSQINGKNRDADGYALYGSISITPTQDLALLLEFKDYHRFQIANPELAENSLPISYHEAPTLERIDQIVLTNASATGARLLAEYYIRAIGMRVYANALWYGWSEPGTYQYDESVDNFGEKASTTLHAYLGLEKRWDGGAYLNVSGGYRLEAPNTIEADDPEFSRRLWHVESDVQIPLGGPHSLGFRTNFRQEEKVVGKVKDFIRGDVAVTYGLAPELSLGLLWTFQTENDTKYAKDTDYFGLSENGKYLNLATEVVWRFSHWGQVSLFAGRNTGGFICVSGVCRLLPPFYGVRSEFVARF